MGRDRTFPRWFANVNPRFRTPWNATILFGLLNIVFLWGTTLIGSIGKALSDIVSSTLASLWRSSTCSPRARRSA